MMVLLAREYMEKMDIKNRMPTWGLWEQFGNIWRKPKEVII